MKISKRLRLEKTINDKIQFFNLLLIDCIELMGYVSVNVNINTILDKNV